MQKSVRFPGTKSAQWLLSTHSLLPRLQKCCFDVLHGGFGSASWLIGACVYLEMFALFACDVGQSSTVMPDLVTLSVNNNTKGVEEVP